jgi:hypothetical protein
MRADPQTEFGSLGPTFKTLVDGKGSLPHLMQFNSTVIHDLESTLVQSDLAQQL